MSTQVDSLLAERQGYVIRGMKNRVAQVDAVLASLGYGVTGDELETADAEPVKRGRKPKG